MSAVIQQRAADLSPIAAVRADAIRSADTEWLRTRETALEALTGSAAVATEDELSEIQAELEWRLTHITVRGQVITIKYQWCSQEIACWRADGEQPNRVGLGADAWEARSELEEMLSDWGCVEDSPEVARADSMGYR